MSGVALAAALLLAPGLEYRQYVCTVAGHAIALSELKAEPRKNLELRALANPGAHPFSLCRDGYGGPDIDALLAPSAAGTALPDFEVLGAVNGTVFRESHGHYVSNSLLWSKGAGLIAPLLRGGGTSLFVADPRGGHAGTLSFVTCKGQDACATLRIEGHVSELLRGPALVPWLMKTYPSLTLAVQSNMPLMDGKMDGARAFTHWSRCPAPNPEQSNDWRCRSLARTVLCSTVDGGISLLTTTGALPFELAQGLRTGGECGTECVFFYNLDGGGSTQQTHRDPDSHSLTTTGRKIETSQPGCSPFRPVDNYLVIGTPGGTPGGRPGGRPK